MLPKAVAEVAKTFIKEGMRLNDAVLAAYRIMDEPVNDAVPPILARDKKFMDSYANDEDDFRLTYWHPAEVVEQTANNLIGLNAPTRGQSLLPQSAKEWREYSHIGRPLPDGPGERPTLTSQEKAYIARQYALRQLGLLD